MKNPVHFCPSVYKPGTGRQAKAVIKAIDEKIEKMKEAMAGTLSKLGKLLLLAAKKFFTWPLRLLARGN
jgi:hypothetical protein